MKYPPMELWFVVKWQKGKVHPVSAVSVHMRLDDARHSARIANRERAPDEILTITGPVRQTPLSTPLNWHINMSQPQHGDVR